MESHGPESSIRRLWPNQRGGAEGLDLLTDGILSASSKPIDFEGWTHAWFLFSYTADPLAAPFGQVLFVPVWILPSGGGFFDTRPANPLGLLVPDDRISPAVAAGAGVQFAAQYDARGGGRILQIQAVEVGSPLTPGKLSIRAWLGTE